MMKKNEARLPASKAVKEDDGLVELTNGTDTVRAHPDQVAHWRTCGFVPSEGN